MDILGPIESAKEPAPVTHLFVDSIGLGVFTCLGGRAWGKKEECAMIGKTIG